MAFGPGDDKVAVINLNLTRLIVEGDAGDMKALFLSLNDATVCALAVIPEPQG